MLEVMRDTIHEVLDGEHAAPRWAALRCAAVCRGVLGQAVLHRGCCRCRCSHPGVR